MVLPARLHGIWIPLAVLVVAALVATGCGAGGTGGSTGALEDELLRYERVWPDGYTEQQTIASDGRIVMRHGEVLERLQISEVEVQQLREALAEPIPTGSPDDSPKRTLTLADGMVIEAPRPDPGSLTELLDRLMDTHSLG